MSAIKRNLALCGVLLLATFFTVLGCGKDPVATETGTGPKCLAPPDSIIGWWALDQLGTTADELVDGNQGDYIGNPSEAAGKVGGALRFDGVDDLISIPDPGANWVYDIAGDITMETWMLSFVIPPPVKMRSGTWMVTMRSRSADFRLL